MHKLKSDTAQLQSQLARYCRDGEEVELNGAVSSRLHHYRRLTRNIMEDSLATAYPLTKQLLPGKKWNKLVDHFFSDHDAQSYQVWQMPKEFVEFALHQNKVELKKYPFLKDLLGLEWKEVEYFCLEDRAFPIKKAEHEIGVNPEHEILQLEWPVHKANALHITADKKGEFYVLIFREPKDKKVIFFELSLIHVAFIELLKSHDGNKEESLLELCTLTGIDNKDFLSEKMEDFIESLRSKGFFY